MKQLFMGHLSGLKRPVVMFAIDIEDFDSIDMVKLTLCCGTRLTWSKRYDVKTTRTSLSGV
tara:strand:+ start:256 stop:438 length:183 start_codon:yes stop_codon:yes gene_type:complete